MVRIFQGKLPKTINVVVNTKVVATARFNDFGIYETENKDVIAELKRYGYEVEEIKEVKPVEEKPQPAIEEVKPKVKPKANKKKGAK